MSTDSTSTASPPSAFDSLLRRVEAELIAPCSDEDGYRRSSLELEEVDAARPPLVLLEGPGERRELVVVVRGDDPPALERRLRRLLRRLADRGTRRREDAVPGGLRPVTVVLAGGEQQRISEELVRSLCRVLVVPEDPSDEQLEELLAPLLPFQLPEPLEPWQSLGEQLTAGLGELAKDPRVKGLLGQANHGEKAVRAEFFRQLARVCALPDEESEEEAGT